MNPSTACGTCGTGIAGSGGYTGGWYEPPSSVAASIWRRRVVVAMSGGGGMASRGFEDRPPPRRGLGFWLPAAGADDAPPCSFPDVLPLESSMSLYPPDGATWCRMLTRQCRKCANNTRIFVLSGSRMMICKHRRKRGDSPKQRSGQGPPLRFRGR
jgi:hypothetical protein